jgi:hypothetical protein
MVAKKGRSGPSNFEKLNLKKKTERCEKVLRKMAASKKFSFSVDFLMEQLFYLGRPVWTD